MINLPFCREEIEKESDPTRTQEKEKIIRNPGESNEMVKNNRLVVFLKIQQILAGLTRKEKDINH